MPSRFLVEHKQLTVFTQCLRVLGLNFGDTSALALECKMDGLETNRRDAEAQRKRQLKQLEGCFAWVSYGTIAKQF
jgi:hypothetical protein